MPEITIDVRSGPVLRTALDVLEYATELIDLVPDWHQGEREELAARGKALTKLVQQTLRTTHQSE